MRRGAMTAASSFTASSSARRRLFRRRRRPSTAAARAAGLATVLLVCLLLLLLSVQSTNGQSTPSSSLSSSLRSRRELHGDGDSGDAAAVDVAADVDAAIPSAATAAAAEAGAASIGPVGPNVGSAVKRTVKRTVRRTTSRRERRRRQRRKLQEQERQLPRRRRPATRPEERLGGERRRRLERERLFLEVTSDHRTVGMLPRAAHHEAADSAEAASMPAAEAEDDAASSAPSFALAATNSENNEQVVVDLDPAAASPRDDKPTAAAASASASSAYRTASDKTTIDKNSDEADDKINGAFDDSKNVNPKKMAKHVSHCEKQSLMYNDTHVKMNMRMFTAQSGQQEGQRQQTMAMSARSAAGNSAAAVTAASAASAKASAAATSATSAQQAAAICTNGYSTDTTNAISYPCSNVDLLSFIPLVTMHQTVTWRYGSDDGYGIGNDVWGWTHSGTGREFALMGFAYGTTVVEVTTPTNPIYLGVIPATYYKRNKWHDIKVKGDYAYVVSEQSDHGLQIFDLRRLLKLSGPDYGRVIKPKRTYTGPDWFGSAHNLVINDNDPDSNLLIAVGVNMCNGGLFIMDISNPLMPKIKNCYGGDGYVHDAECVTYDGPDSDYVGREICFSFNEDTVTIVDVYESGYITILSRFDDPYPPYNSKWRYIHQGWLTEDHRYLLVDDEGDEVGRTQVRTTTYVLDVSNLNNPTFVGAHRATTRATDHNMYIKDGYAYQANYDAGLRILRLDNLERPQSGLVEEAYFDIEPYSNDSEMKGAWSVYPYFPSGTILISSTEEGLFMVRANLQNDPNGCRRLSSEAGGGTACGSNLFTNTFSNNRDYTKIKTVIRPSLPVGGSGGYYVGRLGIPKRRKRQVGAEFVDINVIGSRTIRLVAQVGLEDDVSSGNEYKFRMQVRFDTGRTVSGKVMRLGSSAHNSYKTYSHYVDVPLGARRIEKIEYKVIKPGKVGFKNILLLDKVSIEKDLRSTATATTTTGRAASYNVFNAVAPREDGLR